MRNALVLSLILLIVLLGKPMHAQGPPDPGGPPTNGTPRLGGGAPLGSGTMLLIALGIFYGAGKSRKRIRHFDKDRSLTEVL